VEELAQHRSIVGFRHGQPVAWRIGSDDAEATFIPNAAYQLNDGDAVIEAAIAGLGICQMPVSLVRRHLDSGALRRCWMRTCSGTSTSTRCGHRRATCGRRCATWWMS
jgi:DNA-binding transcriptional LysR family regulator